MRALLGFFVAVGLAVIASRQSHANESVGNEPNVKIVWAAPTNVWPMAAIWSYKAMPQHFSDAVVSNAMAIGSFTWSDERKLPAEALTIDGKAVCFANKEKTRWLEILPTLGYIKYYDQDAEAKAVSAIKDVPEPVAGVPDLAEATRLALNYAISLGIDPSQLAKKQGTDEFDRHWEITRRQWTDQKTQKDMNEIQGFGVDFTRSIGGIEMSGFGDFHVEFGNHAKVHELEMSWRNFRRYQRLRNLITPDEIVQGIRDGEIPLPRLVDLNEAKALTITNAAPRYSRRRGDEPMDVSMPALQMDAVVDNGKTNIPVWFQSGIFRRSGR
jgi:hypothetical protein